MTTATDLGSAPAVIELFEAAGRALRGSPLREHCAVRLPARGRLLATGDLHDNPRHLDRVLQLARLEASADHHIILHEIIHGDRLINGMDFSYRMLGRVAELVRLHPGQVHPLLANHELAQMTGRGVSKGAGNSVELFESALEYVFGDEHEAVREAAYEFIAAMPLALRSDSGLLCAHSLPAPDSMARFDTGILDRDLTPEDYRGPDGAAYLMVWGRRYTAKAVEKLAAAWGVTLFCVGHEHVESGVELRHDRVLILNSDHDQGRAVALDLANLPEPEMALMSAVPLGGGEGTKGLRD